LLDAIGEMEKGLIDAYLGGNLYKKRVKKPGMGKSGGYRTIIASNKDGRWFFIHGFSKNELENLENSTLKALKEFANDLLYNFNIQEFLAQKQIMELSYEKE